MSMQPENNTRQTLGAILDVLIPANPTRNIPAAGELGVADFVTEAMAQNNVLNTALNALLFRAKDLTGGINPHTLRQLESEMPEAFNLLLAETYKGYYSRPDMRTKFGVGSHPVHPRGYMVEQESPEFMNELTAPVRARGPAFRNPTGGQT